MSLVKVINEQGLAAADEQSLKVRGTRALRDYDVETLALLLRSYMLHASRRRKRTSERTLESYAQSVRVFVVWMQENGVSFFRLKPRHGDRFVAFLQDSGLSAASVALRVSGVRALFRALAWAEVLECSVFATLMVDGERTSGVVLNPPYEDELERVLALTDERETVLLLLCAHAGLRISEALALNARDVTWVGRGVRLQVMGKGGKRRVVSGSIRLREALGLMGVSPVGGAALFGWNYDQATYRLKKRFIQAGCGELWRGFHAARKHSATRLYGKCRDFTRVSLFLGHSSVDTTKRYVLVPDSDVSELVEDF